MRRLRRRALIAAPMLRTPAAVVPPGLAVTLVALAPPLAAVEDVRHRLTIEAPRPLAIAAVVAVALTARLVSPSPLLAIAMPIAIARMKIALTPLPPLSSVRTPAIWLPLP